MRNKKRNINVYGEKSRMKNIKYQKQIYRYSEDLYGNRDRNEMRKMKFINK